MHPASLHEIIAIKHAIPSLELKNIMQFLDSHYDLATYIYFSLHCFIYFILFFTLISSLVYGLGVKASGHSTEPQVHSQGSQSIQ